jgi:hypothetical protein
MQRKIHLLNIYCIYTCPILFNYHLKHRADFVHLGPLPVHLPQWTEALSFLQDAYFTFKKIQLRHTLRMPTFKRLCELIRVSKCQFLLNRPARLKIWYLIHRSAYTMPNFQKVKLTKNDMANELVQSKTDQATIFFRSKLPSFILLLQYIWGRRRVYCMIWRK